MSFRELSSPSKRNIGGDMNESSYFQKSVRSLGNLIHVKTRPSVRFGSIEMREYKTILGDNPAGSRGAPLTLDWAYTTLKETPNTVDEYERSCLPRRKYKELHLSSDERENILLSQGVSLSELMNATVAARKARQIRAATVANFKRDMTLYETKKKVKNFFLNRRSST